MSAEHWRTLGAPTTVAALTATASNGHAGGVMKRERRSSTGRCAAAHRVTRSTVMLGALWLAGCGVSHPQTAAEFRTAVTGAYTATKDTFEVERPLAQVAASFQRLASDCLDRTIKTTEHQPGVSYSAVTTSYKPTVRVTATNAELHVQQ